MLDSIIKVQNQLVNHGDNNPHISHTLGDMTKEIKDAIKCSPELEKLLT
jgi:hypothetical protein